MCNKGNKCATEDCESCQDCMAAETLLAIGQASPSKDNHTSLIPASSIPALPQPEAEVLWLAPPTPPPSEPGSMSPHQSEDSCDGMMFEPPKKTSKLAQVSLHS